jgi:hypothetical protein
MMLTVNDPESASERIESLVAELGDGGDPLMRHRVEELVQQLMLFYGACLARVMDLSFAEDECAAAALWERAADDSLIGSVLALHGLHPHTLERRVARALERLQPVLSTHGVRLSVGEIARGAVRLRAESGAESGVWAAVPLVERALIEAAPEIESVEVEGATRSRIPLVQLMRPDGTELTSSVPASLA